MSETVETHEISAAMLGAPGAPHAERCSAAAIAALGRAAGAGMRLTSMQLEVSSKALAAGEVEVRARIDKRTRSIAFVSVEAVQGGQMVFRAQALMGAAK